MCPLILFPFSPYPLPDSVPPFLKKYLRDKELIGEMGVEQGVKKNSDMKFQNPETQMK